MPVGNSSSYNKEIERMSKALKFKANSFSITNIKT